VIVVGIDGDRLGRGRGWSLHGRDRAESRPGNLGRHVPVTAAAAALRVAAAYATWGCGIRPAALNFGDCFAYALAKEYRCPLLFIGADFARTDLPAALS
jgi:uncharacterized protein with PIN domain